MREGAEGAGAAWQEVAGAGGNLGLQGERGAEEGEATWGRGAGAREIEGKQGSSGVGAQNRPTAQVLHTVASSPPLAGGVCPLACASLIPNIPPCLKYIYGLHFYIAFSTMRGFFIFMSAKMHGAEWGDH